MSLVDLNKVKENSGGDRDLLLELLRMGLERIDASVPEMQGAVASGDWEGLARTLHKLRPILCYAGIDAYTVELTELEKHAKSGTGLPELPGRIMSMTGNMQDARRELERVLSELKSPPSSF